MSGDKGFYCFATGLAGSREVPNRKRPEARSAEGGRRRLRRGSHLMYEVKVPPSLDWKPSDTPSAPILLFCPHRRRTDPPPPPTRRQEVTLPFIRSRMKHSLSGVWKAYVMHTMKGQSCKSGGGEKGRNSLS